MPRVVGFAGGAFILGQESVAPPTIITTNLADGRQDLPYSRTIVATGTAPITFAVTAGALPTGLSLNVNTGEISGTPTTVESQTFTVTATNGSGSDDQVLTIDIVLEAEDGAMSQGGMAGATMDSGAMELGAI